MNRSVLYFRPSAACQEALVCNQKLTSASHTLKLQCWACTAIYNSNLCVCVWGGRETDRMREAEKQKDVKDKAQQRCWEEKMTPV